MRKIILLILVTLCLIACRKEKTGEINDKKSIDIPKYDDNQIAIILTEYEEADTTINEDKMELANRLFVAALSGSSKTKEFLSVS